LDKISDLQGVLKDYTIIYAIVCYAQNEKFYMKFETFSHGFAYKKRQAWWPLIYALYMKFDTFFHGLLTKKYLPT
jgi:hypothetical protein